MERETRILIHRIGEKKQQQQRPIVFFVSFLCEMVKLWPKQIPNSKQANHWSKWTDERCCSSNKKASNRWRWREREREEKKNILVGLSKGWQNKNHARTIITYANAKRTKEISLAGYRPFTSFNNCALLAILIEYRVCMHGVLLLLLFFSLFRFLLLFVIIWAVCVVVVVTVVSVAMFDGFFSSSRALCNFIAILFQEEKKKYARTHGPFFQRKGLRRLRPQAHTNLKWAFDEYPVKYA